MERELRSGAEEHHKHPGTVNKHLPAFHDLIRCVSLRWTPREGVRGVFPSADHRSSRRRRCCCAWRGSLGLRCRAQLNPLEGKLARNLQTNKIILRSFLEHFTKAVRLLHPEFLLPSEKQLKIFNLFVKIFNVVLTVHQLFKSSWKGWQRLLLSLINMCVCNVCYLRSTFRCLLRLVSHMLEHMFLFWYTSIIVPIYLIAV